MTAATFEGPHRRPRPGSREVPPALPAHLRCPGSGRGAAGVLRRWCAFNFVGLVGVGLQLLLLWFFTSAVGLPYLLSTALSVELTVLHNFVWHERWTWSDRPSGSFRGVAGRLLRFNASNGAVSLVGNVLLMRVFVGTFGIPIVAANLVAIGICSLVNFVLSDRFVFGLHRI